MKAGEEEEEEEAEAPAPHFYSVNYLTVNSQLFGTFPSLRIFNHFKRQKGKKKKKKKSQQVNK